MNWLRAVWQRFRGGQPPPKQEHEDARRWLAEIEDRERRRRIAQLALDARRRPR